MYHDPIEISLPFVEVGAENMKKEQCDKMCTEQKRTNELVALILRFLQRSLKTVQLLSKDWSWSLYESLKTDQENCCSTVMQHCSMRTTSNN